MVIINMYLSETLPQNSLIFFCKKYLWKDSSIVEGLSRISFKLLSLMMSSTPNDQRFLSCRTSLQSGLDFFFMAIILFIKLKISGYFLVNALSAFSRLFDLLFLLIKINLILKSNLYSKCKRNLFLFQDE